MPIRIAIPMALKKGLETRSFHNTKPAENWYWWILNNHWGGRGNEVVGNFVAPVHTVLDPRVWRNSSKKSNR